MSEQEKSVTRARFFVQRVENEAKTKEEGKLVYDEVEMVEFLIPGDDKLRPVAYAHEDAGHGVTYAEKFFQDYAKFKNNDLSQRVGIPLEDWPDFPAVRILDLKRLNIFTIEDLAAIPDTSLARLGMGGRQLRSEAKAYLSEKKDDKTVIMEREIAELRDMVKALLAGQKAVEPVRIPETIAPSGMMRIEDMGDDQLKDYIKRVSGEGIRGNPSRATLIARVQTLVSGEQAAA
jgi:hypothetical protein